MSNKLLRNAAISLRARVRGRTRVVIVGVTLSLVASVVTVLALPDSDEPGKLPPVHADKVIEHSTLTSVGPRALPKRDTPIRPVSWPAAGEAEVTFAQGKSDRQRAGSLPISVAPVKATTEQTAVRVKVLDHAAVTRAGVTGVIASISPTKAGVDTVSVGIDYSDFANAAGAGYGSRLTLVALPSCVSTTPEKPECQVQRPLRAKNDAVARQVTAEVPLTEVTPTGKVPASAGMTIATVAEGSGPEGAFQASSLSPSGTWAVSGNSGAFTWSYPIALPPVAVNGPAVPSVGLSYNSSSVDGQTAGTNNQSSWVGQGWDYSPGYIERTYRPCKDDTTIPADRKTGDLCWAGQIVTMNLGGQSTPLVYDAALGWHPANDSGQKVELITGGNNTARDGEHWKITTTDGVEYWFGRDRGPGYSNQEVTNSAWTVPVYHPAPDPCSTSAALTQPGCAQAWRWNLDFIRDPHGNTSIYYYNKETNFYGANDATAGVTYTRGGTLKRIDYGIREVSGSVYGATVPAQVVFDLKERCVPGGAVTCDPAQFTAANASAWPDTPQDQQCLSGATCNIHSPTFWSTKRLDKITTQYNIGAGAVKVDSYQLGAHLDTLVSPSLVLDSITRTGWDAAGGSLVSPPVSFTSQTRDNRVAGYGGMPGMAFWRLTNIRSETGSDTKITYSATECTKETVPTDLANVAKLCFPVYRTLPYNENPALDFFHKYVVTRVEVQDTTGQSPPQVSTYRYLGAPAWHFDDNEVVKPANRTYGQFRGYPQVEVLTGDTTYTPPGATQPDKQTLTRSTYFRGMNGDTLPTGVRTVNIANSLGEPAVPDNNLYQGTAYEVQTFNGDGGAQLSTSITDPTTIATTATRARTGLPALTANIVGADRTREITNLVPTGTRTTTVANRYDTTGRVTATTNSATGLADICTTTKYAENPALWIKDRVKETITSTQACPADGQLQAPIVSAGRTYFDQQATLGSIPGLGDPTRVDTATSVSAGQPVFQTAGTAAFDASGRVVSATNALGRTTTTAYTPALDGIVSKIVSTNPKSQTSTVNLEPSRGVTVSTVDVANRKTEARYDQLGRLTELWQPGRAPGGEPNVKHSYLLRNNGPLVVTTQTLVDYGGDSNNYVTTKTLLDSLGQVRQTQSDDVSNPAGVSNRVITDTFYDSHGWKQRSNNRYVTSGVPGTTLVGVADQNVDDRTVTTFDGAGRAVVSTAYKGLAPTWDAKTIYGGDRVTTIPPQGGVPSTVVSDARGQTTELRQYMTAPTVTGDVVSGGNPTTTLYTSNVLGQLEKLTDAAGNEWKFEYDFLGRQQKRIDPDAGTSTTAYDLAGQVTSTMDARGQVLSYEYDVLGRKLAEYSGPVGGTKLASWVYDTAQNGLGKVHSSTRHTPTGDYTVSTTGYNGNGMPFDVVVTVPASETGLDGSHKTQFGYTSTNLLTYMSPVFKGGLPGENIRYTYDRFGNPQSTRGVNTIVANSAYSSVGEPLRYSLGGVDQVALSFDRDTQTHRVNQSTMSAVQALPQIDDVRYTHDPAGNLKKAVNVQGHPGAGAQTRTECFTYDGLDRLSQAWTATDDCASAPSSSTVGGPTPYWTSWSFDAIGSRTQQVQHQAPGGSGGDTTTDYRYPDSGPGSVRPHAPMSTATTGPAGATSSTSFEYYPGGNAKTRNVAGDGQFLDWTENNRLASVSTSAGTTAYVYDADGNQLIRRDPGKTTLYLPGEEIARNLSTGAVTGTRYYTHNGTTIAVRNTGENPTYLKADMHGTNQVAVQSNTANGTYAVTRRTFDPYGKPLGAAQGTNTWPDTHGFLDKPTNASTGLTDIGARNYDPALGQFISVDPILDLANPQGWTGYGYANNNPITLSDPTGLDPKGGPCVGGVTGAGYACTEDTPWIGIGGGSGSGGNAGSNPSGGGVLSKQALIDGIAAKAFRSGPGHKVDSKLLASLSSASDDQRATDVFMAWAYANGTTCEDYFSGSGFKSACVQMAASPSFKEDLSNTFGDIATSVSMALLTGIAVYGAAVTAGLLVIACPICAGAIASVSPEIPVLAFGVELAAGGVAAVGAGKAAKTATDGVSLSLKYKSGWTAAQRAAADSKVAALNDAAQAGGLRVTPVQRAGTSAASRYRSAGGTVPRGADIDHTIDLQLGGRDDIANMSPLDASVNRSLGSQIMWKLRGVEPGTCVIAVLIC